MIMEHVKSAAILIPVGFVGLGVASAVRFYVIQQERMTEPIHLALLIVAGACLLVIGAGSGYWTKAKGYPWWVGMFFGSLGVLTCFGYLIFTVLMLYVPDRTKPIH